MENRPKTCLNCGATVDGRFCPYCGQSVATARFGMRSFGVHLVSSLTRVSGDFLRTAWGLLSHPWNVVRNYIYGRRVGLVSPVAMLLMLALYWGVIMAVIQHFTPAQQQLPDQNGALLNWLYGSVTFQYLFLAIPMALGTWAVYRKDMQGRFNFAELLIATLYLASTFLLVCFILMPLAWFNDPLSNALIVAVTAAYGIVSITKAFPQPSAKATAVKLTLWITLSALLLFLFLLLFALPFISSALHSATP